MDQVALARTKSQQHDEIFLCYVVVVVFVGVRSFFTGTIQTYSYFHYHSVELALIDAWYIRFLVNITVPHLQTHRCSSCQSFLVLLKVYQGICKWHGIVFFFEDLPFKIALVYISWLSFRHITSDTIKTSFEFKWDCHLIKHQSLQWAELPC